MRDLGKPLRPLTVSLHFESEVLFSFKSLLLHWGDDSVKNRVLHWCFSLCLFADRWDVCPQRRLYPYRDVSSTCADAVFVPSVFPTKRSCTEPCCSSTCTDGLMLLTLHHMHVTNPCRVVFCSRGSEGVFKMLLLKWFMPLKHFEWRTWWD